MYSEWTKQSENQKTYQLNYFISRYLFNMQYHPWKWATCAHPAPRVAWLGWAEKNIWGTQINFNFIFEREDQTKEKRCSSWPLIFVRATSFAQGGTFIAWRGAARFNGANLAFCPQIRRWRKRKKKRSSAQNLMLSLGVQACFSFWNQFSLTFGGTQAVFYGAQAPKSTLVAPDLLLSFGAQSPLVGAQFSVGGHKQWFGGRDSPEMPSSGTGHENVPIAGNRRQSQKDKY